MESEILPTTMPIFGQLFTTATLQSRRYASPAAHGSSNIQGPEDDLPKSLPRGQRVPARADEC